MAVDIMFYMGVAFLIAVLNPLGLTLVHHLQGVSDRPTVGAKSSKVIKAGLDIFIGKAKRRNFDVVGIQIDGERGVTPLIAAIESTGISVDVKGPGGHIHVVERKIRTIKERARAIRNNLPFVMCRALIILCVLFCVKMVNLIPSSNSGVAASPFEKYSGRKLHAKLDLQVEFGT